MGSFVGYRDNGKTNEQGLKEELNRLFTKGVPMVDTPTSLAVSQRAAGANMSVDVAIGDAHLVIPSGLYSYWAWTDAVTNVTVTAANVSNPRIDVLVAYVDLSVTSTSSSNNPGALKFSAVAGTPAGSPTVASDSTIQAALGANVPFIKLAQIAVAANATNVVNANLTDVRQSIALKAALSANIVTTAAIADGSVTPNKQADTALFAAVNTAEATATQTYTDLATVTDTVTVVIGNNGKARVTLQARLYNNSAISESWASFAISGATTVAAADTRALMYQAFANNSYGQIGGSWVVTGLTPGSTTFKMKYRVNGNTGTFENRQISVEPL
jgi:hypothetical protein